MPMIFFACAVQYRDGIHVLMIDIWQTRTSFWAICCQPIVVAHFIVFAFSHPLK